MAKKSGKAGKDKNYISIWHWLLLFLLFALPCIGLVFLGIFAFIGENESRKNYCRASIILILLAVVIWGGIIMLGLSSAIIAAIQTWLQQHHWHF